MKKHSSGMNSTYFVMIFLCAVLCLIIWFYSRPMFFAAAAVCLLAVAALAFGGVYRKKRIQSGAESVNTLLFGDSQTALDSAALPIAVLSKSGKIIWFNKALAAASEADASLYGCGIDELCGEDTYDSLRHCESAEVRIGQKSFKAVLVESEKNDVVFFSDHTELKNLKELYSRSRPVIAFIEIDSFGESSKKLKESEKIQVRSVIQHTVEDWFGGADGIIKSISDGSYMLIFEESALTKFVEDKFSIVKKVRELAFDNASGFTVSVGAAHRCKNFKECARLAWNALEMAQGRGGDQAALKAPDEEYAFFGGVKSAKETSKKVKARIVAGALSKLIAEAENIVIMGHKYSDLDCVGASYALYSAMRSADKQVCVALNKETSLAKPLLDMIEQNDPSCPILSGKELDSAVEQGTLLIVVDTHRPAFMDFESVYHAAGTVVIIDHHRKATDYAEKPVIFYHETAVSSACEMCTELLQYINEDCVGTLQANALLAGIMLDTKNFVMHTGVRTFEAAAFLRRCGADPVVVKKLFSESVDVCKRRYEIVASAELYEDCAISKSEISDGYSRVSAAQAADELLTVSGVSASFVMCPAGSQINISARSYGDVNVQLIMERLGGGGHKTVAACQLDTDDYAEARSMLIHAIDDYNKDR